VALGLRNRLMWRFFAAMRPKGATPAELNRHADCFCGRTATLDRGLP